MAWPPRKKNPRFDVYAFRKRMGLSQEELAKKLVVHDRTINRWERHGMKPPRWQVLKMQRMEQDKLAGRTEREATAPPTVRRALPGMSAQTGHPRSIGIPPSSF